MIIVALQLFGALLVLMLLNVPPWIYAAILIAGVLRAWHQAPVRRLAERSRRVAQRTRTRARSARGKKLNGSAPA